MNVLDPTPSLREQLIADLDGSCAARLTRDLHDWARRYRRAGNPSMFGACLAAITVIEQRAAVLRR